LQVGRTISDEVADEAAGNPGADTVRVAQIEIARRVAPAQMEAAEAQRAATLQLKITAWATVFLSLATAGLALATYWTK
jgi:hypothetical protein